jgi:hypothetical protein
MTHHHEEEKNYDYIYYLVGLLSGLFTGVVIGGSCIWVPILGLFGLLFAAFFIKLFVHGRERA